MTTNKFWQGYLMYYLGTSFVYTYSTTFICFRIASLTSNSKGVTMYQIKKAMLHKMLNLFFGNFKLIFQRMHILSVPTYLLYLRLYICLSWCLHFKLISLFGDKSVRVLGLHIWNHLRETLRAKSSFQAPKRYLTNFMLLVSFDTPWKHQKTRGFMMFSGGIERDQWHEMVKLLVWL